MDGKPTHPIIVDLNHFKLYLRVKPDVEFTLHFNTPSRKFYLSVIALVIHEMKKRGKVVSIPLSEHHQVLALLNETVGGSAGSSKKEQLLYRLYRKWKDALPDLESSPLFNIVGRKKRYNDPTDSRYGFREIEKDNWANLFEYKGSHDQVRLRFSIDRLGLTLDDVAIVYGSGSEAEQPDGWERFIASLNKAKIEGESDSESSGYQLTPERQIRELIRSNQNAANKKLFVVLTSLCLVALALVGGWKVLKHKPLQSDSTSVSESQGLSIPSQPSIAVLPFVNMTDDPRQDYFTDGMSEDIITAISKTPKIFVIARNSTFAYKGKPTDVKDIGRDLGVKYVLEGSVRKIEEDIRINAQLIDAQTGRHLWAEKYDRKLIDIFDLQDEITHEILTALQVELTEGEQERVYLRGTSNLEAYFKVIEARELVRHFNVEENKKARLLLEEAVKLEPNYAQAYRWLGASTAMDVWLGVSKSPKDSLDKSVELQKQAISIDGSMGEAYGSMGFIHVLRKKYEEGLEAMKKGVEFSPNSADAHTYLAGGLLYADKLDEAILMALKGIRLNPLAPSWYLNNLSAMYRSKGEFEEALKWSEKAVAQEPQNVISRVNLTSIYALLDRMDEARQSAEEVTRLNPKFSLNRLEKTLPYKNPEVKKQYIGALRKAGLPYSEMPLPDKPSIAVLPFDNMSDDPKQEFFSDGITEDIITALSKTPKMFVIARNSTFTYKDKSVDIKEVGEKFGVRYVLEGSVRKSGDDIRINAQLVDTQTGHHIWAEKYDRNLSDIFELQDEITKTIVTELHVELTEGEQARIFGKGTKYLDAYLKFLEARSLIQQLNLEDNQRAHQILKETIAIDSNFAHAYRWLGAAHFGDVFLGVSKSKKDSLDKAIELAKKAITIDESYGDAHGLLGLMYVLKRKYDQGIPILEKALELDPNGADTNNYLAMSYLYLDDLERALSYQKTAIRLNPIAPSMYLNIMAAIYRSQGNYGEALQWAQRAVNEAPKHTISRVNYCSILVLTGQGEKARIQADKVKELNPKFSVKNLENSLPYKNSEVKRIYISALREAGLPD